MIYPGSCTYVIKMGLAAKYKDPAGNEYESPFLDKKVREAFAYAFDAEGWAEDVLTAACRPRPGPGSRPGTLGTTRPRRMKFDPELAKKALAESSFGGPEKLNALV